MQDVLNKLTSNLDEVSCNYVEHHELLLNLMPAISKLLVNKDLYWTDTDKALLKRNQELVQAGTPPFLKQVNLDWSSSYTNLYGLYDIPRPILNKVNGQAVIDGGGFIGDTLTLFRDLFPQSQLYSFEPASDSFNTLTKLLAQDIQSGRLIAEKVALGAQAGTITLNRTHAQASHPDAAASTSIDYHHPELSEEVKVITLDDYVTEHQLQVGLIKLDVEGAEPDIIQGALNTIKSQRPILALAFYHTPEEYYELKPYLESLNLGYKFMIRRSCFSLPLCDTILVAYPQE